MTASTAAQKEFGPKLKTQIIENINYADMEQALTNLASKNQLVIGVGGQTQAAVLKIAKRFPEREVLDRRRQQGRDDAAERRGL